MYSKNGISKYGANDVSVIERVENMVGTREKLMVAILIFFYSLSVFKNDFSPRSFKVRTMKVH